MTREGIIQRHGLSNKEFERIAKQMKEIKLIDIMFHCPDGPRHDIALHLIAYAR